MQVSADECLARIMGEQAQMVVTTRVRTQEEQNLKSAILAQYAQVTWLFIMVIVSLLFIWMTCEQHCYISRYCAMI